MTTLLKSIFITAAILAGAGIFYEARQAAIARAEVQSLQKQQVTLSRQIEQLQQERERAANGLAGMAEEMAKNQKNNLELLSLRGEVTRLKSQPSAGNIASTNTKDESEERSEARLMDGVKNASGVVLNGGQILNFTNGVAVVPGSDYPHSATDREEYVIGRMLGLDDHSYYCETSVNRGGSGTEVSLGIFTRDDKQVVKSLQMLDVGDRVQIYNCEQEDGKVNVYYLDHGDGVGMASPPNLPKKTVFQLNPATGKYIKGATFVMAEKNPRAAEPAELDSR